MAQVSVLRKEHFKSSYQFVNMDDHHSRNRLFNLPTKRTFSDISVCTVCKIQLELLPIRVEISNKENAAVRLQKVIKLFFWGGSVTGGCLYP